MTISEPASPPSQRPSLRDRILRGGALSIVGFGTAQVIRLISNLTMARLLMPDAFSLLAMAITLQVLMIMVSDLGINQSIIRSKSTEDTTFIWTAWVTQIARSGLISLLLALFALGVFIADRNGWVKTGTVFDDPRLPIFIIVVALCAMIEGTRSMKMVLCQRDLRFERLIPMEIGAQVMGFAVMLIAYYVGAGAYSFLANSLTSSSLIALGSYLMLKGPSMRFAFNRKHFREIFNYGKWILPASFLAFLLQRGDHFIFGSVLNTTDYGLYAIATIWITVVILLIDMLQMRVAYPSLSEVWRDRPERLAHVYGTFRLAFDGICLAVFFGIVFLGDFFFSILYPEEFEGVSFYLRLLSVIVLLLPYRLLGSAILAEGKSRNFLWINVGSTIMMMVGTPLVFWLTNAKTAIVFSTLSYLPSIPLSWMFARRFMKISMLREIPIGIFAVIAALFLLTR